MNLQIYISIYWIWYKVILYSLSVDILKDKNHKTTPVEGAFKESPVIIIILFTESRHFSYSTTVSSNQVNASIFCFTIFS